MFKSQIVTKYVMKCACDPSKTDNNTDHKFTLHNNDGIEITCTGNRDYLIKTTFFWKNLCD